MIVDYKKWVPVLRPGYLGADRDSFAVHLNATYGRDKWIYAWKYFGSYYPFVAAFEFCYVRSYFEHFRRTPEDLAELLTFDEVLVVDRTDIDSGTDCRIQQHKITHLADIAIRKAMMMHGQEFHNSGTRNYMKVAPGENGHKYHPGVISFFLPDQILKTKLSPDTTEPGTVDDFWQNNKFVLVHPDAVPKEQPIFGANN